MDLDRHLKSMQAALQFRRGLVTFHRPIVDREKVQGLNGSKVCC